MSDQASASFVPWQNAGYCHCCRSKTNFKAYGEWLRDMYLCERCGSIPRQRNIQYVLDAFFPGWELKKIHESSPSADFIAKIAKGYTSSQYFEGVIEGTSHLGTRCENLERLTFPSESIDIFVTQDVLEHVFKPDVAVREVHRVLKKGGFHIFTTPKHRGLPKSYVRALMNEDGTINYVLPAEYHGNPVGDGRALVTWDYGSDLDTLLSHWALATVCSFSTVEPSLGIDDQYNEVFVIRK